MKLRLSHALFRAVMACFAPAVTLGLASVSQAANLHSSPTIQTYTDIAEGRGIYRFAYGASLIAYQNGEPTYTLAITPTFTSTCDGGYFTLVNNGSFQLTVDHNGVMSNNTFSTRYVGQDEAGSATTLYIATPATAVPEPATATLSLLALFAARGAPPPSLVSPPPTAHPSL